MNDEIKANEPGCVEYQVSVSTENPREVLLYECYCGEPALLSHRETAHFHSIVEGEIVPMLEKRQREIIEVRISQPTGFSSAAIDISPEGPIMEAKSAAA